MSKQPKALELAEYLDWGATGRRTLQSSAAELRRQHAEIADLWEQLERKSDIITRLLNERDELRAMVDPARGVK